MKIKKIHIDGFGKLHDYEIEPGDGINVFYGLNEAGKSTLHLFIRSILYGASVKRKAGVPSCYERMRPWQRPEIYRGRMEIEFEQQRYMIERDFNKAPDDLTITELGQGRAVSNPDELIRHMLNGLSETAYVNTVSSGQLGAATQKDLAPELRKYSSNISSTMNPNLSADRAIAYLDAEKARLESELDTDAAKDYNIVITEIKRIEEAMELPENDNKITYLTEAADKVSRGSAEIGSRMDDAEAEFRGFSDALKLKGFSTEEEINSIESRVKSDHESLMTLRKRAHSKATAACIVLFAAAAAALTVYGCRYAADAFMLIACAGAGAFAVIAVALIVRLAVLRKHCHMAEDEFAELIRPYTGDCDSDAEGMRLFDEYISGAKKLYQEMSDIRIRQDVLSEEQRKLKDEYESYLSRLNLQQKQLSEREIQLTRLSSLKGHAVELKRRIKDNKLIRERIEAVQLASETLTELASEIRNAAGTYINKEASSMIASITGNVYDSISAGLSYDIRLNSPDGMIAVSDMSAGTADQVYLAIRLATIRFITGEDDPIPLILDDSFNLFDDNRLEESLRFLSSGYKGQVLIFTCQKREEEVLDKAGIAYRKIDM